MNKKLGFAYLFAIVGAIALGHAQPARADDAVAPVAAPAPAVAQAMPAASPAPSPSPSASPAPKPFQYGAYADMGYTSATFATKSSTTLGPGLPSVANAIVAVPPINAGGYINSEYVFDNLNNQIQFHNFNLQASYTGPIGGKVEASFGNDANVINSYPKSQLNAPFNAGSDIDITQAYLSFSSGQFTGIVGKFETLAGAEVIESPSDYEFSRSILFGYAVPFTHTGGRLTWAANGDLSLIVGLNKGWDTTKQLNAFQNGSQIVPFGVAGCGSLNGCGYNDSGSLTLEAGAAWNPSKAIGVTMQGYTGQVEEGSAVATVCAFTCNPARPNKSLIDTVITWHFNPALTFVVNGDAGQQTNSNLYGPQGQLVGYGTATWSGVAGYANYAINSLWSATARLEYLGDYGGQRTGQTQRWGEATITLQYSPNSNLIVRGEVRGDGSNQLFFLGGPNVTQYYTNQQFGLEMIVHS